MLSEIQDVKGKMANSSLTIKPFNCDQNFLKCLMILFFFFYCSAETKMYFFTGVNLYEKPK